MPVLPSRLRRPIERLRAAQQAARDRQVSVIAAGVAFYGFLAVPPGLGSMASLYGLFADPDDIERQVESTAGALSPETQRFLVEQLRSIGDVDPTGLGLAALGSLLLALWSASAGMALLIRGVRIAAHAPPASGFVRRRAVGFVLTIGAIVLLVTMLAVVALLPALLGRWGLGPVVRTTLHWLRWPIVWLGTTVALGVVYDVALRRRSGSVRPAPAVAATLWFVASVALSVYASNFGSYERTYGPLASIVVVMFWLYAGAYAALFGAVLEETRASGRAATD